MEVTTAVTETFCRVTIADAGPGIPESHLPRVFDRFFLYRPDGGRGYHLGLGLAIARQIVGSYGGGLPLPTGKGAGPCSKSNFDAFEPPLTDLFAASCIQVRSA